MSVRPRARPPAPCLSWSVYQPLLDLFGLSCVSSAYFGCFVTFINSLTACTPQSTPLCPLLVVISVSAPAWVYLLPTSPSRHTYQQLLMQFECAACTVFADDLFEPALWEQWNKLMEASVPKHALAHNVSANKAQHWEVFRLPLTKTKMKTKTKTITKTTTKTSTTGAVDQINGSWRA